MKLMALNGMTYMLIMCAIIRGFFFKASQNRRMHLC
jgi:hypothetical protein